MEGRLNRGFLHTVIERHNETNKMQMDIIMNFDYFITVTPSWAYMDRSHVVGECFQLKQVNRDVYLSVYL